MVLLHLPLNSTSQQCTVHIALEKGARFSSKTLMRHATLSQV